MQVRAAAVNVAAGKRANGAYPSELSPEVEALMAQVSRRPKVNI